MANLGQLPVKFVDDKRMFPKQAIDHLAPTNAPTRKTETKAHKISEHPQRVLSPVKDIRETELQETARTLNKTINQVRQMVDAGDLIKDPANSRLVPPNQVSSRQRTKRSEAEKQEDFTAEEAAEYLDESLSSIYRMIRNKELPLDNRKIPARSVLELYDSKLGQKLSSQASEYDSTSSGNPSQENKQVPRDVQEPTDEVKKLLQDRSDSQETNEPARRVKELEGELRIAREEKERLSEELEQEREEHQQDVQDSQYEIDRLDAELAKIRKSANNSVLGSRLKQEIERRKEAERWGRELESQLDKEMVLKSERERWFADLESKLDHSETTRTELEEALAREKQKVRRLKADTRTLAEIRRLLGEETAEQSEHNDAIAHTKDSQREASQASGELIFQTQHGRWVFHPPFDLDDEEVKLIRLVAREEEITAEQIRHKKGRRSVERLNDLLDRLHDVGVEPILEVDDRYNFDPNFLQE